jgi:hypothetical protein
MATGSPVYGKQYIRFAETFLVAEGAEVNQFRVVELTGTPGLHPPLEVAQSNGGAAVGVAQYLVNDNVPPTGFATDRQRVLTVATSGLLLVDAVSGGDTPVAGDIGTALEVNGVGQAVTNGAGAAVLVNGTAPTIRDVINIGGQNYVLASFS